MISEPQTVPTNGDTPATQHDLSLLAGEMVRRFDVVDERLVDTRTQLTTIDQRLDTSEEHLNRQYENIFELLNSIDENVRELKTLPDRVERLERSVFGRE